MNNKWWRKYIGHFLYTGHWPKWDLVSSNALHCKIGRMKDITIIVKSDEDGISLKFEDDRTYVISPDKALELARLLKEKAERYQ